MYDIKDRSEAVREIQRMLLTIASEDPAMPRQVINGIYTERMADGVLYFQSTRGLSESGDVDYETWMAISREAEIIKEELAFAALPHISPDSPLSLGSRGHSVTVLQSAIFELGDIYRELPRLAVSGSYGEGTAYAVSLLQRKYGLEETGLVDRRTWARIMNDRETRERLAKEINR